LDSLYKHLKEAGSLAAQTILTQINDNYFKEIEEYTKKTSSEALKDLDFIDSNTATTSLSGLKELANTFGIKFEDLVNNYYNWTTQ